MEAGRHNPRAHHPTLLSVPTLNVTYISDIDNQAVDSKFEGHAENHIRILSANASSIRYNLKTFLIITQWCFLFPVEGILEEDSDLCFNIFIQYISGQERSRPLVCRDRLIIVGIMSTIGLELAGFLESLSKVLVCSEDTWILINLSVADMYNVFFKLTSFSLWKATIPSIFSLMNSMLWILMNLKIIFLSSSIVSNLRRINERLIEVKYKRMPRTFWLYMRETYNSVNGLNIRLDEHLGWMNVCCFGLPLYNITSVMLLTLTVTDTLKWSANLYKLFYLTTAFLMTSFVASSIHEESKVPVQILFSVPAESFNNEVSRFQTQVCQSEMALTGCNYFSITRSFILTVAGTIVTYEIVLVQFGSMETFIEDVNATSLCQPLMNILRDGDFNF